MLAVFVFNPARHTQHTILRRINCREHLCLNMHLSTVSICFLLITTIRMRSVTTNGLTFLRALFDELCDMRVRKRKALRNYKLFIFKERVKLLTFDSCMRL